MRFTYDFYKNGVRVDTASRIDPSKKLEDGEFIKVTDNLKKTEYNITNDEDLDQWFNTLARIETWKPQIKEAIDKAYIDIRLQGEPTLTDIIDQQIRAEGLQHLHYKPEEHYIPNDGGIKPPSKETPINPNHYKNIVPGLQYMEAMQYMLDDVESHLMGQTYKYLMRTGKKDEEIQELKKARWYLDFLIAFIENGRKPIKIEDVARLKDD